MSIILFLLIYVLKPGDHPDDGRRGAAFVLPHSLALPKFLETKEKEKEEIRKDRKEKKS